MPRSWAMRPGTGGIREGFNRLRTFGEVVQGIRDSRTRVDRLFPIVEDITNAVERLWELAPIDC